jgi:hypothetical protein
LNVEATTSSRCSCVSTCEIVTCLRTKDAGYGRGSDVFIPLTARSMVSAQFTVAGVATEGCSKYFVVEFLKIKVCSSFQKSLERRSWLLRREASARSCCCDNQHQRVMPINQSAVLERNVMQMSMISDSEVCHIYTGVQEPSDDAVSTLFEASTSARR